MMVELHFLEHPGLRFFFLGRSDEEGGSVLLSMYAAAYKADVSTLTSTKTHHGIVHSCRALRCSVVQRSPED
jgi:hypothetical protein